MLGLDIGRNRELIALALPCSAKSSNPQYSKLVWPVIVMYTGVRFYNLTTTPIAFASRIFSLLGKRCMCGIHLISIRGIVAETSGHTEWQ